jgi:HK97 family phage prohead protease
MDKLERRTYGQPETRAVRADIADGKTAGGYAALYNSPSEILGDFREVLAPGAFDESLRKVAAGEANVYLFWQHDHADILASTQSGTLRLFGDDLGLRFEFDIDGLDEKQRKTLARKDLQVSFGFYTHRDAWEDKADGVFVRTVFELELTEVSLVTYPAYSATSVALRSRDAWVAERNAVETKEIIREALQTGPTEDEIRESASRFEELRMELLRRHADNVSKR